MTREGYLKECKKVARQRLREQGPRFAALAFVSDIRHSELTQGDIKLACLLPASIDLESTVEVEKFIQGWT
jgi:hypothetical protein